VEVSVIWWSTKLLPQAGWP